MKEPGTINDRKVAFMNTHYGIAVKMFQRSASFVRGFNVKQVEEVFDLFYNKNSGERGDLEKLVHLLNG